ncbi:MAG: glucose-6-phosphate isomerase [Bacteroidota bacterium]
MTNIKLDITHILPFIDRHELDLLQPELNLQHQLLMNQTGAGNDFLGWMSLPDDIDDALLSRIETEAARIASLAEYVVVIGIGGSYLGTRAILEAMQHHFASQMPGKSYPKIIYAGQNISEDYLKDLLDLLDLHTYALLVVSKSGTTTEPAIAFRVLRQHLEAKLGKVAAREHIIAITDKERGALKGVSDMEGYPTYVIPDDVGGRFSVLTPVGLLPIAIAGYNIREFVNGAREMKKQAQGSPDFEKNPCTLYAAARNLLYRGGKPVEVMVNYEPRLTFFTEWWKQLYGESEGKQQRGIFPAGVNFTTDLHSLGQYLQDGLRMLFETVILVEKPNRELIIPKEDKDFDGLNFLAGKPLHYVNQQAAQGTLLAHLDGGVPVMQLKIPQLNERTLGELVYFFEFACALSAYVLDVNPFDQPGVEDYKKNMFALLGKPGYEAEGEVLKKRLI